MPESTPGPVVVSYEDCYREYLTGVKTLIKDIEEAPGATPEQVFGEVVAAFAEVSRIVPVTQATALSHMLGAAIVHDAFERMKK